MIVLGQTQDLGHIRPHGLSHGLDHGHSQSHSHGPDAHSHHPEAAHTRAPAAAPDQEPAHPGIHDRKKIGLYCGLTTAGIALIVVLGIGVMPRSKDADQQSSWRDIFSLQIKPAQKTTALRVGQIPLGIKPETIYTLHARPYFSRSSEGHVTAEFEMDSGLYTVWFGSDQEGRRAQRIRFARTFDGLAADQILKTQISSFGMPMQSECSTLLAHQGRGHCRYLWSRPDGTSAAMILRSIAPSMGDQRTEMVLTVTAPPPGKGKAGSRRDEKPGQSL